MAEVKIREFADVMGGQHFRRKVKVAQGEDEKGKPIIVDEWEYVLANQFFGDQGFTVRNGPRVDAEGHVHPEMVTGGGNGDYIVKDLVNGNLMAVRQPDFAAQYERISVSRLPKAMKEKVGESDAADVEG